MNTKLGMSYELFWVLDRVLYLFYLRCFILWRLGSNLE